MSASDKDKIIESALDLFAKQGLSNTTLDDISKQSGISLEKIHEFYDIPGDILQEAFKTGQRKMEELYREPVLGDLDSYLERMFEGLDAMISPWGPELYLYTLQQATKDKLLRDAFSRTSRTMGFAVKSFLAQMVAMSIVDEINNVEKVNEFLVTSFIEGIAQTLSSVPLDEIKRNWISKGSTLFTPSSMTHVQLDD